MNASIYVKLDVSLKKRCAQLTYPIFGREKHKKTNKTKHVLMRLALPEEEQHQ